MWFEVVLPRDFMLFKDRQSQSLETKSLSITSTCSFDQLSILNDLTFDICVPSLRCRAAHRMHRKIPSYMIISSNNLCGIGRTDTPAGPSYVTISSTKSNSIGNTYLDSWRRSLRTDHCLVPS